MINPNLLNELQTVSLEEIRSLNSHARLLINEANVCKNFDRDQLKASAYLLAAGLLLDTAERLLKTANIPTPETDAQ